MKYEVEQETLKAAYDCAWYVREIYGAKLKQAEGTYAGDVYQEHYDKAMKFILFYEEVVLNRRETLLLYRLGLTAYTKRHIRLITDFLETGETDIKKLLSKLGNWDENDLKTAQDWFDELKK